MLDDPLAEEVWRAMASVAFDNRDAWKRAVIETTGLPFSRVRVLRRLTRGPLTAKEIAEAASMDAPATSVVVNDLEDRGPVVREAHPNNRRCKSISLTDAGHRVIGRIDEVDDPAPEPLAALGESELRTLRAILAKVIAD